jgi:hypothetical protein
MATFASLVAPFGGFFASGFKRAFNIKDFGHSIPGHGGMTDRMDCQYVQLPFTVYPTDIQIHDGYLCLYLLLVPNPNPERIAWIDSTDCSDLAHTRGAVGVVGRLEKVPLWTRRKSVDEVRNRWKR